MADEKTIHSVMGEERKFEPPKEFAEKAYINSLDQYQEMYQRSVDDPEGFWAEQAEELIDFYEPWTDVLEYDFNEARITWFKGAKLNASYNCLDRHLTTWRKNKAALIWEGDEPGENKTYTYLELYNEVNKFANVLKKLGVQKGDRVAIYLPMIPELAIAVLACARIGAVHSVVFGGFSSDSLRDRILDADCCLLITSDGSFRGSRVIPLKKNADAALDECPGVNHSIIVKRTGVEVEMAEGRDLWWHDLMAADDVRGYCEPEKMDAEDPLFILYTSGSTGQPKGVLHTTAGYMVYTSCTFKYIFDYKDEDTYWCTADIGWITGHSYIVYGPLAQGATSLMFEGVPNYPDAGRFWDVVEKYKVNIFYTAPTAIRAIAKSGDEIPKRYDMSSLKLLGTVGEPINPEAWMWYYNIIGGGNCPIVDTWWQTETGGILITPLAGAWPIKPGAATKPFFGVEPEVLRENGETCDINEGGYLVINKPWPGIMRTVYGEHERFRETYFSQFPGRYYTGDGARLDEDGDYWLMGRLDDVINVSGHRMGTAEVESALVSHETVAESAVVGFPHEIKGQGIYAFVTLNTGVEATDDLKKELVQHVRK